MSAVARVSVVAPLLLGACAADGVGTIEVDAWGEEAAREGFPAGEIEDGWVIDLAHDVFALRDVTAASQADGRTAGALDGAVVIDHHLLTAPASLGAFAAPAGRVDLSFAVSPPPTDARPVGATDPALVAELASQGWSVLVEGTATKGEATVHFRWGFPVDEVYDRCENGFDGTAGIAVPARRTVGATLTFHADHLWWDRLGTEEARLRFQAIADADADHDGEVTLDELAAVDLATIGYETSGLDLDDLAAFVRAGVTMSPHLDGEGLCRARRR